MDLLFEMFVGILLCFGVAAGHCEGSLFFVGYEGTLTIVFCIEEEI